MTQLKLTGNVSKGHESTSQQQPHNTSVYLCKMWRCFRKTLLPVWLQCRKISVEKQHSSSTDKLNALCVGSFAGELIVHTYLSHVVRKQAFCICENKDTDQLRGYIQLRGNREADQCICFRYTDTTIPLLPLYEMSSL